MRRKIRWFSRQIKMAQKEEVVEGPIQEFNCATIRGACGTVSHEESGNEMEVNSIATMEEPFKDAVVVEDKQETMMPVHDDFKE